ncbi:unnamed protein product [Rhizophagus irregularis]|nr:unnamed protein product [Rhizophagus irregularis]
MTKAFSEDLKWRIVYLWNDSYSARHISRLFYISEKTIYRVINYYKLWKNIKNPIKANPGRKKSFNNSDLNVLTQLINEKPDMYLDEMAVEMALRTGKTISIASIWRSLKYCRITRKKLEKAVKERSEILRGHYIMTIGMYFQLEQLIFIDESAKDERTACRQYGYSSRNQAAVKKVVFLRGVRYTILPALSLDGIIALDIMEDSCNKERFRNFILAKVLPNMNAFPQQNNVLVMDNAQIHHDEYLVNFIESIGCKIIYLPPYSPDLNPIETAFSSIKSWIKRHRNFVSECSDPYFALTIACAQVTPSMSRSYFQKSLYL